MTPDSEIPERELRTSLTIDGIKDVFNTLIMILLYAIKLYNET